MDVGRGEADQRRAFGAHVACPGRPRGQRVQAALEAADVPAADELVHGHVAGHAPNVAVHVDNLAVAADGPIIRLGAVAAPCRVTVEVPGVAQAPVRQDTRRDGSSYGRHCVFLSFSLFFFL